MNLLGRVEPFKSYNFGRLSPVLAGQIRRGHYVFTIDGDRIVGYAGWALCDEKIAHAWVEQRYVPTFMECLEGDSLVGVTFYAASRAACFHQARYCRRQHPHKKVFGIRDYGSRQRKATVESRLALTR